MAEDTPKREGGDGVLDIRTQDSAKESAAEAVGEPADAVTVDHKAHPQPGASRARGRIAKPRRRWPWVVALLVVIGLLVASAMMTYEMRERSLAWSDRVDDIVASNHDLGEQIAEVRSEGVRLKGHIDLLDQQLANAKDTVLKLSDEKAQWRDDTEFAQLQVAATEDLLTTATAVANALQRCTDGQVKLMEYLANADDYEDAELAAYEDSVTELCLNAEQANVDLQKALTE